MLLKVLIRLAQALVDQDLRAPDTASTGACGLSVESIFRCLLLKQFTSVSYEMLAFHLRDSATYRCFACLNSDQEPSRSGLQSTIREISPFTLQSINQLLITHRIENDGLSMDALRIDSTVVLSNIHPPSDSSLLYDGIRVLSRMMAKCKESLGVKLRFTNQRKRAKSLEFRIFYAKNAEKKDLYPELLGCSNIVNKQVNRAIETVQLAKCKAEPVQQWVEEVEHHRSLMLRVVDQTQRRIYNGETVPASEKIVSLFEEHTDIIIKGERDQEWVRRLCLVVSAKLQPDSDGAFLLGIGRKLRTMLMPKSLEKRRGEN